MMIDHHAYLNCVSEVKIESLKPIIDALGIYEVSYITSDSFGIADVRTLTEQAYIMPGEGEKKLMVVLAKFITEEAQQALLKILEEPPKTTVFLFCIPESLYLLPTLLSRFQKVSTDQADENIDIRTFVEFTNMGIGERFLEITNRLAKKDQQWIGEIKSGLIQFLKTDSKKISVDKLAIFYWISDNLLTRGASNKQLLEELALSL